MAYQMYDGEADDHGSKFPKTALLARLVTMASLIVSLVLLKTNTATMDNGFVYTYNYFQSYKYLFYVAIIGVVYSLLQLPSAIYYMIRKKALINRHGFLVFDFYADKVMVLVVATAVGAAFGTTMDSKNVRWGEKMQDFLSVSYIPSAFGLLACIASAISSVQSSLALKNR